jgi:hypothetical protein
MYKKNIAFICVLFTLLIISYHAYAATAYLYWDPPESGGPVDGYMVYWSKDSGIYNETNAMNVEQNTEAEVTWLDDDEVYYFVVKAYNLSGMSPISNEVVYRSEAPDDSNSGGNDTGGDSTTENTDGGGGCFIATAAYGSAFEPHVKILKDFRDHYLMSSASGRRFVAFYYKHSPGVAELIAKHNILKIITRWSLTPVIGTAYIVLKTNATEKAAILTGVTILMLACWLFLRKRRELRSSVFIGSRL